MYTLKVYNDIEDEDIITSIMDLKIQCFGSKLFNYIPEHCIIVFNDKNKVIGYTGIEDTDTSIHIDSLCIDKDYRKKGLGRSILDKACELGKSQNKKQINLEIDRFKSNATDLTTFYNKCGFTGNLVFGYSSIIFTKDI
jgi:ribosomal protein S18 acetylase RimI-like enzyme